MDLASERSLVRVASPVIDISFAPSFHYVGMLARTCIAFRVASRIHYVVALRSSRSSASQRQLQPPCYDAMANIYRSMPLPKIAVCIFLRRPSCVQLRGCQVSSPADKSTRSSTCSPVQDRGLRGCWSHPHLRSAQRSTSFGKP